MNKEIKQLVKPRSLEEMEALEKITTAYHEAGHVVIAMAYGARCCRCSILRNAGGAEDEKVWLGWANFGGFFRDRRNFGNLWEIRQRQIVGAAGVIAERAATEKEGLCVGDTGEFEIFHWDLLSASDLDSISDGDLKPHVVFKRAETMLIKRWGIVKLIAEKLMIEESLSDYELNEMWTDYEKNRRKNRREELRRKR